MKLYMNKAKNDMPDQLSNKVCKALKIVEDKIAYQETYAFKDTSNTSFGRDSATCKYLVHCNVIELKYCEAFTKFIGTYFFYCDLLLLLYQHY